jgi:hypothetical protein
LAGRFRSLKTKKPAEAGLCSRVSTARTYRCLVLVAATGNAARLSPNEPREGEAIYQIFGRNYQAARPTVPQLT